MKNQIYGAIAILAVIFALSFSTTQAQSASRIEVRIPFEFSAGSKTLRAGVYSIKRVSGDILMLKQVDGKAGVLLTAPITETSTDPNAVERMIFSKYGDRYQLSEIWLTSDSGRRVRRDRTDAKRERVEIALNMN